MEKSTLEQYVREEAEKRFNRQLYEMVKMLMNHPIMGRLRIQLPNHKKEEWAFADLVGYLPGNCIFGITYTDRGALGAHGNITNFDILKAEILKQYEATVLAELLDKVEQHRLLASTETQDI